MSIICVLYALDKENIVTSGSEVLIIGKKVTNKDWFLGNKVIKEIQGWLPNILELPSISNSRIPSTSMTT